MNVGDYSEWRRYCFDREKYVCFRCRVCFKWPHERAASIAVAGRSSAYSGRLDGPRCPHCRAPMQAMGYTYGAPRRDDHRGWARDAQQYARAR